MLRVICIYLLTYFHSCTQVLGGCSRMSCFCCQPLKLMCNGLLRSIKNYFCCHLRNGGASGGGSSASRTRKLHCPQGPMIRSSTSSFSPSNLFNERIYELSDNSGSVMTGTPTFTSNHHGRQQPIMRGDDVIIHSRNFQTQVCVYLLR